jgi:hypothetical protein
MAEKALQSFTKGTHNIVDDEIIPDDAASSSYNWYTRDGRLKLINGKILEGAQGAAGKITGEIFGYKTDGTKVHWRKRGTVIEYYNGSSWVTTVTGLTSNADYSFSNYSSLAGTFTFATGIDGIFKMNNANPGSYNNMTASTKGLSLIDKGRMLLWNNANNKTNLYGSRQDRQNTLVGYYTTVTGEATTSLTGTLAFKAGSALRNCFGVVITLSGTGEVYSDGGLGIMTGSLGGTGTINYMTGAYTLSNAGVGTASYQWENSNSNGLTDFTYSATRLAGEGFYLPQDVGGDAILNVVIGQDGNYYSIKNESIYQLSIDSGDLIFSNQVYRRELGVPCYRASTSMQYGIVFMNTANYERPEMTLLEKNPIGGQVTPRVLFTHFKFSNYDYSDCTIDTYDKYVLVACRTLGSLTNNVILICDVENKTVDVTGYAGRTFAKDEGDLFMGSSITESVYKLFDGYDDDGAAIGNYWTGKGETWSSENLKKYRKIRLMGQISADQSFGVYLNYDGAGEQLVGTVLGSGSYVDYSSPQSIGSNMIGDAQIGGDDVSTVYNYFVEIRLKKVPKFRKRQVTFRALGIGYVDINSQLDLDIDTYEGKIPSRFRQKQNVSLSGDQTNLDNPIY